MKVNTNLPISKMRTFLLLSFFSIVLFSSYGTSNVLNAPVAHQDDQLDVYDSIMLSIQARQKAIDVAQCDAYAAAFLGAANADGSFNDIDYANADQTNWICLHHLYRLHYVVVSYSLPGSVYYNSDSVYDAIVRMFNLWYDKNPQSTNWFYQKVSTPQNVGMILIMMRSAPKQLPADLEAKLIQRMKDDGGKPDEDGSQGTAVNKVEIAVHWVFRGVLTKDKEVLDKGVQQSFEPLMHTEDEGFQHDYSYHQHGPQLYISGYGEAMVNAVCYMAQYLRGTKYALSDEKFQILFSFVRNGLIPVIRGNYTLFNVQGRGIAGANANIRGTGTLELVKAVDVDNAAVYDAAIKRVSLQESPSYGIEPYHAHFWRSDSTLHQRPGYTMDVRMVSTSTDRNEHGNGENLTGFFLSDGATDIAVDGDEYVNIYPVWDWGRIPGTTTPALSTRNIPFPKTWGNLGETNFVGGVSDGVYGVSTYDMNVKEFATVNTEAKKSWFFFDEEVVCLGAGIKSTTSLGMSVNTTLDQCLLKGAVKILKTDYSNETLERGTHKGNDISWILHNKVGYYLPQGGNVTISNDEQKGRWRILSNTGSNDVIGMDVFKAYIDHGERPTDGSYAYVIVPNVNTPEKVAAYDTSNVVILENSALKQAVYHKGLDILGVVFHSASTFTWSDDISIRATEPCVVMMKGLSKDEIKVAVADPTRLLSELSLIVKFPKLTGKKELQCELPVGYGFKGSPANYVINEQTPEYIGSGITEIDAEKNGSLFKVYPNPVKQGAIVKVEIDGRFNNYELRINTISGKTVSRSIDNSAVDTAPLSPGIYMIQLYDKHQKLIDTQKLIVE